MATKIEWAEETWNFGPGCKKVSEGCGQPRWGDDDEGGCYAIRDSARLAGNPNPKIAEAYAGLVQRDERGRLDWTGRVNLLPERLNKPFEWKTPRLIFVQSMGDLFHDSSPDGFIARVWDVMARNPHHTFLILTKRPGRMRSWVKRWADTASDHNVPAEGPLNDCLPPMPRGPEAVRAVYNSGRAQLFADMLDSMGEPPAGAAYPLYDWMEGQRWWPQILPNVVLGVSVELQKWALVRIPLLLDTPAAWRFLSCEPLLGPLDLRAVRIGNSTIDCLLGEVWQDGVIGQDPVESAHIDWVIAGGESGRGARPMHPDWVRSLRDQCTTAGVPLLFKQWGEWSPRNEPWKPTEKRGDGAVWVSYSDGMTKPWGDITGTEEMGSLAAMYRVGKAAAGRELDGQIWDEFPAVMG